MPEAQLLVSLLPIIEEHWNQRTIADLRRMRQTAFEGMSQMGEVISPLRASFAEQAEIEGYRLVWEDEVGNPLPPLVFVRYEAMAIPHGGVDVG